MSVRATAFSVAMLICATLLSPSSADAQANPCDSQSQRVICSQQCCGGKTCAPACEADCVRACVAACKNPSAASSYTNQLSSYQKRCGNRSVR